MKKNELNLDSDLINEKARQIGDLIDGLRLPEVFCILGTVVVELVLNAKQQGYIVGDVVSDWLKELSKGVRNLPDDEDDSGMLN